MKTLILNGSPHKNGDTSYIVNELKKKNRWRNRRNIFI